MKISKDAKAMTIITTSGAAALMFVLATNSYAGQGYNYGPRNAGYGYYNQQSATPGYMYGAPDRQASYRGYGQQNAAASVQTDIKIANMQFQPAVIKVNAGEEVSWANTGEMPHIVAGANGNKLASSRMGSGSIFKHTFNEPGTYTYYCSLHPSMTGKIIVE